MARERRAALAVVVVRRLAPAQLDAGDLLTTKPGRCSSAWRSGMGQGGAGTLKALSRRSRVAADRLRRAAPGPGERRSRRPGPVTAALHHDRRVPAAMTPNPATAGRAQRPTGPR